MKTKKVLHSTMVILMALGWQVSLDAQDIPVNYTQNPNMEHDLNSIFWYGGWDADYGSDGIASFPSAYLTNTESHSGNWSLHFFAQWHYIWISYPVRGQEQKRMKNSFWYKGTMQYFNNYIYRDVRMTEDDLPPALAEYVGADSVWHQYPAQDAIRFEFLQDEEDGYTDDWTYFEFVWDMPGTIKGDLNTTMWYADVPGGYVDDIYYGEWYDGQYSGEEPFGFINGDFEQEGLNIEWLVNIFPGGLVESSDFLSWTENHTVAGLQSLRLQDYKEVSIDTVNEVITIDTSDVDRNVTYYLPALGAEGKSMELSFWYKGNDARLGIEFYDDYGVTTSEFPLPEGARLYADSANAVFVLDTVGVYYDTVDTFIDTFMVMELGDYENILELQIDTLTLETDTVLAFGNLDDQENLKLTPGAWVWSGSNYWGWDAWADAVSTDEAWSESNSLWLPGDPNWSGGRGFVSGIVDDTSYIWEFMYKGQVQFVLRLATGKDDAAHGTKYDLINDPAGIVPADAVFDENSIMWELSSEYWTKFRFEYTQGSWMADSNITSPATIEFDFVGSYTEGDVGYVDDFRVAIGSPIDPVVVDTNYVVIDTNYDIETIYDIDTTGSTYHLMGAMWDLPAAADWTEWKLNWTNPTTDIGGTLTLILDNDATDTPDILIPLEKPGFNDDHAGWTYFDDFVYSESTGWLNRDLVKYDLHTYPNPAQDVLYLSIQDPLNRIEVYNSLGQLQMVLDSPERVLNISNLEKGIFFLNVTDEKGVVHKTKFVKQ